VAVLNRPPYNTPSTFPFPQSKPIPLSVTFVDGQLSVTFPFGETSSANDTAENPSLYVYRVYAVAPKFSKRVVVRGIIRVLFSEPPEVGVVIKSPNPTYTPQQNTTITTQQKAPISWDRPAGVPPGTNVTGYELTTRYPDGTVQVVSTASTFHLIEGLDQHTTYSVTVAVVTDRFGRAKASPPLAFTTDATDLAPIVNASGKLISWTAPDVLPPPLDYAIQYTLPDGRVILEKASRLLIGPAASGISSGTLKYEFDMPSGVQYEVKIAAISQLGVLTYSAPVNVGASGAPGPVVFSQFSLVNMVPVFSWGAPANDGGTPVLSYSIDIFKRVAGGFSFDKIAQATLPAGTTTYSVPNAVAGEVYSITVRAVNSFGQAQNPSASGIVLVARKSTPPRNLSLEAGDRSIEVSWQQPLDIGGGVFSSYEVTCEPTNQSSPRVVLSVQNQGTTKTKIESLTNGLEYAVSVVAVTNLSALTVALSSSDPASGTVTVTQRPGVPTSVTLTPGDQSIDISWTAPLIAATGYKVYIIRPSNGSVVVRTTVGTSFSEAGLVNGETYFVQVSALILSVEGEKTTGASTTVGIVPAAPTDLRLTPGVKSIVATWTRPTSSSTSPILAYDVLLRRQGQPTQTVLPASGTSLTLTNLLPGATYEVSVRALNVIGPGPYSSTEAATTTGKLAAPTQVAAVLNGSGMATITWTPPSTPSSTPIIRYSVKVNSSTQIATQSGFLASGFTGGHATQYYVSVAAENADGVGEYSMPILTLGALAPAPRGLAVLSGVAAGTVEAAWFVQVNDNMPVLGFVLSYRKSAGEPETRLTLPATATRQTIEGLEEGTQYSVSLSIVDAAGEGLPASGTAIAQPAAGVPTGLTVAADSGRLAISWQAPLVGATSYKVYITRQSTGAVVVRSTTGTSFSETGLVNGETYSVQVSAINITGEGAKTAAVVKAVADVPAPTQVAAVPNGIGMALVTWTPPYTPSEQPIIRYLVKVDGVVQSTTQTSLNASGFGGGHSTQHSVSVAAETAAGVGAYSGPIQVPGAVANSPTGFASAAGNGSVSLSWPTQANDGVPVLGFVLAYIKAGDATETRVTLPSSATSYTASNLENGKLYNFWLTIVDAAGEGSRLNSLSAAMPTGTPDTVTGVTAAARAKGMVISWTAPKSNSDIGVTDYSIEYTPAGGSAAIISRGGTTPSIGLYAKRPTGSPLYPPAVAILASTAYTIRVAARNDVGLGPWSAPATVTTLAAAAPSAPTRLTVDGTAYSELGLRWYPPSDAGTADIKGYIVNVALVGQTAANITLTPPAVSLSEMSMYAVPNLTHGANYTVRVSAFSDDGTGTAATAQASPDGGPQVTSLTAIGGSGKIDASWGVPTTGYFGNTGELSYSVQVAEGQHTSGSNGLLSSMPSFAEYTIQSTSYTIVGIANGRVYTVAVAPKKNGVVIGQYQYAVATTGGPPPQPAAFTATPTKTGMQLRWQEPADTYGKVFYPITKYVLTLSGNGGATITSLDLTRDNTSYLHTGLTPNAAYWYTITCQNSKGVSSQVQIAQKYWSIVPSAVTGVTTSVTGKAITVRWGVPADQGLEPVYRYRVDISLFGRSGSELVDAPTTYRTIALWPAMVGVPTQPLGPGTYTISVTAINSSGLGPTVSTTATIV
jgi:titin